LYSFSKNDGTIAKQEMADAMEHDSQPVLSPPVDRLMLVTTYPTARATMNATRLRTLIPAGTPTVLHLYTG